MTSNTSGSSDHVIKKSVKIYHHQIDEDDDQDDARKKLGTEAIEQLASGLNLAAHTIQEYSQNVSKFKMHKIKRLKMRRGNSFYCRLDLVQTNVFFSCISYKVQNAQSTLRTKFQIILFKTVIDTEGFILVQAGLKWAFWEKNEELYL